MPKIPIDWREAILRLGLASSPSVRELARKAVLS
jgi:hypothetical protein